MSRTCIRHISNSKSKIRTTDQINYELMMKDSENFTFEKKTKAGATFYFNGDVGQADNRLIQLRRDLCNELKKAIGG